MKRLLTEQEKTTLLDEFKKKLDEVQSDKIEFSKPIEKKRVKVYYTPEAFAKSVRLIMSHTTEIAWHCLVRRKEEDFEVYDVLSYPQTVGAANVNVKMTRDSRDIPKDPTKYYTDWYIDTVMSMSEEDEANLCGQCHSHVNMGTSPSSTDLKQQKEELENKNGYYLFQIWNKKLDINTFLFDIDNGIEYEKDDVEIVIEEDDFTTKSHDMLVEPPKPKTWTTVPPLGYVDDWHDQWRQDSFLDGYYPGYQYQKKEEKKTELKHWEIEVSGKTIKVVYIVEAPTKDQAEEGFWYWAYENVDFVAADLEEDIDNFENSIDSWEFSEAAESKEKVIDISWDELLSAFEDMGVEGSMK